MTTTTMKSLVCRFLLLVAVLLGTNNAVVVDAQCSDISKCDECLEAGCASSDRTCYDSCEEAEADHVRCYVWSEWSYLSSEELCELAMAEQLNQEEGTVESVFEAPLDEEDDEEEEEEEEEEENDSVSTTDSPTDSPDIIDNDNNEEQDEEEDEDELEDTTVPPTPAPMISINNVANMNDTETEAVTLMEDEGEDKEEEEQDEVPPEADNLNTNVAVFEDEEPTDTITNQTTGGDQGGVNGENPDDPSFEGWVVAEVNRDTTGASAAANTNSAMVAIGMSIIALFSGLLGTSSLVQV